MAIAILYRWKIRSGTDEQFIEAWSEATRQIRERCQSYGARLHRGDDHIFVSYACWPSEERRQACRGDTGLRELPCFAAMEGCIAERLGEELLTVDGDELEPLPSRVKNLPTLMTERLCVRPLVEADADALAPALMSDENMRYWSSAALDSLTAVRKYIQWNIHGDGVECYAITTIEHADEALGWVVLIDHERNSAEIGFILRPDAQGHGYAREAASTVIRRAFGERRIRRLMADVDPDNKPSIALIESLGFAYEGRLRGAWETHIGVRDSLIYGMLAADLPKFRD